MKFSRTPAFRPNDDLAPAVATMRKQWAELREQMARLDRDVVRDGNFAATTWRRALLEDFWMRHEAALCGIGLGGLEELDSASIDAALNDFAAGEVEALEEGILQHAAKSAEAKEQLAISLLEILTALEAQTEQEWQVMTPENRQRYAEALLALRQNRAGMLELLPAELREDWERRLG